MSRPLVGLTAFTEDVLREGPHRMSVRLVRSTYVDAAERAGALAVLLPARLGAEPSDVARVLGRLDGLVLVGGGDIAGRWFGEPDHLHIGGVDPARDEWEIALAREAIARDLPVLGVCRGMQVLAVADGGSVEQHLPDRLGHNDHATGEGGIYRHVVTSEANTATARLLGAQWVAHCHHHQGVGALGSFRPSAWSADGVLEAMERPGHRFCLGVQSHPETIPDDRLFTALVSAAQVSE